MGWFSRTPKPDPAGPMRDLRRQALTVEAAALNLKPTPARPHVWGVLMETGYPEATATLVVFADGTTSMYFSSGGGAIGAGEHAPVRAAAEQLLAIAESQVSRFTPASDTGLPAAGRVKFLVRAFQGTLGAEAGEAELGAGGHRLSDVFFAAHAVITAVRQAAPAQ